MVTPIFDTYVKAPTELKPELNGPKLTITPDFEKHLIIPKTFKYKIRLSHFQIVTSPMIKPVAQANKNTHTIKLTHTIRFTSDGQTRIIKPKSNPKVSIITTHSLDHEHVLIKARINGIVGTFIDTKLK